MKADYEIQGPTRVCSVTGQVLDAGMRFYAVLIEEDGKFVRKDYAASAWQGPPPEAIAFWMGRVPASDQPRKPTFNDDLLLDCFHHLEGATEPNRIHFRYVVALLLMRRKRLKFEDMTREGEATALIVRDIKTRKRHLVADPRLSEDEIAAVQDEVFRVLGWD